MLIEQAPVFSPLNDCSSLFVASIGIGSTLLEMTGFAIVFDLWTGESVQDKSTFLQYDAEIGCDSISPF
jgi:hypothetical protein